jgi:hypothetical protein
VPVVSSTEDTAGHCANEGTAKTPDPRTSWSVSTAIAGQIQPVTRRQPMIDRRLKILSISRELLPSLFMRDDLANVQNGRLVKITGWPEDGAIVGLNYNIWRDTVDVQVESATFPIPKDGEELERFTLTVETQAMPTGDLCVDLFTVTSPIIESGSISSISTTPVDPKTMNTAAVSGLPQGFLGKQLARAQESIKTWPDWMKPKPREQAKEDLRAWIAKELGATDADEPIVLEVK